MKTIYLIRHGETEANREGVFRGRNQIPLSKNGIEQAKELSEHCAGMSVQLVFSSPLARAMQTAEIAFPGQPISPEELVNNVDLGTWTGRPKAEIEAEQPDAWRLWVTTPEKLQVPGGESLDAVWARARSFLQKIAALEFKTAVVVSHRSVLKALIAAAVGLTTDWYWRFHMENASISALLLDEHRGFTLSKLNDTAHLTKYVFEWV